MELRVTGIPTGDAKISEEGGKKQTKNKLLQIFLRKAELFSRKYL